MTDEQTGSVAARSPDGGDGRHWFKEIVLRVLPGHRFDPDTMDHTANLAGAVQAAIQAGVHPKGEPWFVGSRPHPIAPDNHILTYAVPAVPSIGDDEPETTLTPTQVTLAAQARQDEPSAPVGTAQSHPAAQPETPMWTAVPGDELPEVPAIEPDSVPLDPAPATEPDPTQ